MALANSNTRRNFLKAAPEGMIRLAKVIGGAA
jgi:hypothetical protein